MRFSSGINHFLSIIISLFIIYSCSESNNFLELKIENAYAKKPPVGSNEVAAYMSITNATDESISINGIFCFGSKASFLHDQRINPESGMIYMNKIDNLIINPRETVPFKPGGKHVMIMGVDVDLEMKKIISCFLTSKKGKKFPVSYVIR
tara:strand:- start:285 stop:734 length:450 start_codon:yes stop_codon:yes gene_type:complete